MDDFRFQIADCIGGAIRDSRIALNPRRELIDSTAAPHSRPSGRSLPGYLIASSLFDSVAPADSPVRPIRLLVRNRPPPLLLNRRSFPQRKVSTSGGDDHESHYQQHRVVAPSVCF